MNVLSYAKLNRLFFFYRIAYLDFKDGTDKAFELNGSDMGGWSIVVDQPREKSSGGFGGGGRSGGGRFGSGRSGGGRGRDSGRGRFGGGRGGGRGRASRRASEAFLRSRPHPPGCTAPHAGP